MTTLKKPQSMSFGFNSQKNGLRSTILLNQTSALSKQFFTNLIELETRFQNNKSCTAETLNQLIQYYAKAVEYYDQTKDDISSYFAFKIQDILATKKSLKMLLKGSQGTEDKENVRPSQNSFIESKASGNKSQEATQKGISHKKTKESAKPEIYKEAEEFELENPNEDKVNELATEKELHTTIKHIKNKKKRFVNLFCKVESEIDTHKQNMDAALNNFESSQSNNDNYIQTDLLSQKDKLKKRLERRKHESFICHSLNVSSSHMNPSFIIQEIYERKDMCSPIFKRTLGISDVRGDLSDKNRFSITVSSECDLPSANLSVEELEPKMLDPSINGCQEMEKQEARKDPSCVLALLTKKGEDDSFYEERNSTGTDSNSGKD